MPPQVALSDTLTLSVPSSASSCDECATTGELQGSAVLTPHVKVRAVLLQASLPGSVMVPPHGVLQPLALHLHEQML